MAHQVPKEFGKEFRKEFTLDKDYVPINHGSYGTYPKALQPLLNTYREKAEHNPDKWVRLEVGSILQENIKAVAEFVHCDSDDIVFVTNASEAANAILRSFPFKSGDKIICFQTAYTTVDLTMKFIRDHYGVELIQIQLDYPMEDVDIIQLTQEAIEKEQQDSGEHNIRLCVMDAITSLPGVRLPFESISKLVQSYGIKSFVDGAHAIGQINLNLAELDPDFFLSNCHKWLYTPRGCAILYVAKRNQSQVHPVSINQHYTFYNQGSSHDDAVSSFQNEFFPPTKDISSYLVVKEAIAYRESIGGEEKINAYCHDLAVEGGKLVAEILGTQVMENSTHTLTASMVNVELPAFNSSKTDRELAVLFMKKILTEHNTMAPIFKQNGKWWVRLCAQIYTDLDDFRYAAKAVEAIVKDFDSV